MKTDTTPIPRWSSTITPPRPDLRGPGIARGSADRTWIATTAPASGSSSSARAAGWSLGTTPTAPISRISDGREIKRFRTNQDHGADHFANFIAAVRSRNQADLKADILEGHLSSALCHTGNISYRLGSTRAPEEIREAVKAQPGMAEALGRMEEHLAANQVDLRKTPATLGALLNMDAKTERFIGNEAANPLLTRDYRHPFVVPEKV